MERDFQAALEATRARLAEQREAIEKAERVRRQVFGADLLHQSHVTGRPA
jgi:hypothetical protein